MGETLKSPSLIEALCEFRYAPSTPWDWTIPGQIYDRIKSEFPKRKEVRAIGVQIQPGAEATFTNIQTGPERIQLIRSDDSALVQVGPNLLVINHLRPYPRWEVFRDLIMKILEEYCSISQLSKLHRIGLRYINQFMLPKDEIKIDHYLTLDPPLQGVLDKPLNKFYQRYEFVQDNPCGFIIHQTGFQEVKDNLAIMLDIDFGSFEVTELKETQDIGTWLDLAHNRVYEAFVASLNHTFYERLKKGNL